MKLGLLKPAKALNKAYFKQSLKSDQIELFKSELKKTFNHIDENQDEEYHKNLISDFLKDVYCKNKYLVNVNKKQDLVIRLGNGTTDDVGVILEFKKPTEKKDMVSKDKANVKALQELVLYYLRETVDHENHQIKHLIVTNIYEWFIFDGVWFEKNVFNNTLLKKDYKNWDVTKHGTDHFYKFIAAKYFDLFEEEVPCTYFNLKDAEKILDKSELNEKEEETIINLFKILSPEHLLKLPFANDSNSLNKEFYNELLHIIGLEETKDSAKKIIERKKEATRNEGSLIENTITVLKRTKYFGYSTDEETEQKYFEIALELNITWLNRILFLKLLEGQLIKYNNSTDYSFLNEDRIKNFDELDELFFEVLAVPNSERENSLAKLFSNIPYLNSSLFEPTDLEKTYQGIKQLKDRLSMPIYENTVFKDGIGKRITGDKLTLQYLFLFLDAYDFASESSAKIQKENKSVINASVLGLIFEKINGYKDGSFFTPGFITMYMCRETIRKTVLQKFNETMEKWNCKTYEELKDKIDHSEKQERKKANEIINTIKICDIAVGSGHFLVSALNELIAVKSDLRILNNRDGSKVKGFKIEIENDELIITNEETDILFEYRLNQNGKPISELQELQEALFHEKQILIENCLFGVDINPKSVIICRLRLWIELLKNSYYTKESKYEHLETLPNIDINIKCGNSLISRFAINDKHSILPKDREFVKQLILKYNILVAGYKNSLDKKAKDDYRRQIGYIKTEFEKFALPNDKEYALLKKKKAELMQTVIVFDHKESERLNKLSKEVAELEKVYTEKFKSLYGNSFEWRFEFPEVLDKEGQFQGFDLVIGNPPYISLSKIKEQANYFINAGYKTYSKGSDIYCLFFERGNQILKQNGLITYITSNSWLKAIYGELLKKYFFENLQPISLLNIEDIQIFDQATVESNIITLKKTKGVKSFPVASLTKSYVIGSSLTVFFEGNCFEFKIPETTEWTIGNIESKALKLKIEQNSKRLKEFEVKINFGIKTGYNSAFIINEKIKNKLINEDPKCTELIKPILRGRDIKSWKFDFVDLWVVFVPKGFTIKKNLLRKNPNFLQEPTPRYGNMEFDDAWYWFHQEYPSISNHLLLYKKQAETRQDKGDFWWEQRACSYLDEFLKPKIIWGEISDKPKFAYDDRNYYAEATTFFMTGENLKYLLAVLNSKVSQWYFDQISTTTGMGTNRWKKYKIELLPIKEISEKQQQPFINIVNKIIDAKSKNQQADIGELEKKIDEMVYNLYGITPDEQKIIKECL